MICQESHTLYESSKYLKLSSCRAGGGLPAHSHLNEYSTSPQLNSTPSSHELNGSECHAHSSGRALGGFPAHHQLNSSFTSLFLSSSHSSTGLNVTLCQVVEPGGACRPTTSNARSVVFLTTTFPRIWNFSSILSGFRSNCSYLPKTHTQKKKCEFSASENVSEDMATGDDVGCPNILGFPTLLDARMFQNIRTSYSPRKFGHPTDHGLSDILRTTDI